MFDTTNVRHESKVVAVTKEIEKTISPDKVTEMYDKVHEEVEATILRKLHVEDNTLNGVVMECEDRYDTRLRHVYLRFTLNGIEYTHKDTLTEALTETQLYEAVRKFYDDTLAKMLMQRTVPKITKL